MWDIYDSYILPGPDRGDYNVVLSRNECQRPKCCPDPLSEHLCTLFYDNHLVDIYPSPIVPTWHNGRSGDAYIGKRLDRFMIHQNLFEITRNLRSRVEQVYILDHCPIVLQWRVESVRKGIHFKFNQTWLEEDDFNEMVNAIWK